MFVRMDFHCVMVRYGEIGIKSEQIRSKYERLLVGNIEAMLAENGIPFDEITRERGRIFVYSADPGAAGAVARVFGVVSASPVAVTGTFFACSTSNARLFWSSHCMMPMFAVFVIVLVRLCTVPSGSTNVVGVVTL